MYALQSSPAPGLCTHNNKMLGRVSRTARPNAHLSWFPTRAKRKNDQINSTRAGISSEQRYGFACVTERRPAGSILVHEIIYIFGCVSIDTPNSVIIVSRIDLHYPNKIIISVGNRATSEHAKHGARRGFSEIYFLASLNKHDHGASRRFIDTQT